jgi:hypothetical protein
MNHSTTLLFMSLGLVGCGSDATDDDGGGDSNPDSAETVSVRESVRAEFLANNLGVLFATDLTVDILALKEAGSAFEMIQGSLHSWGRDKLGNQSSLIDPCVKVIPTSDPDVFNATFDDCLVGMARDRQLDATGTVTFEDFQYSLEVDWTVRVESLANMSGTYSASWDQIYQDLEPDTNATIEAIYRNDPYKGRTMTVTGAKVELTGRQDWPPNITIPAAGSPDTGLKIAWSGRDDALDLGMTLVRQNDNTYTGQFWGAYTAANGQSIALENGRLTMHHSTDVTVTWNGSTSSDTQSIDLQSVTQDWLSQEGRFTGSVGFTASSKSSVDLADWSTPLDFRVYSIDPVEVTGSKGTLSATGPVEFGLISEDSQGAEHDVWFFGNCTELSQKQDDAFPNQGACTFGNADKDSLGVQYQANTPTEGWVLVDDGSGEWICRNLNTHEEQNAGETDSAPAACPN